MSVDKETLDVYAAKADEYATLTSGAVEDQSLKAFIGGVLAGGYVLDLGCGPGLMAAQMVKAGLSVDAVDAVPEMVALANAQDGVSARVASFDDIEGEDVYDGIWANFSLLHAPKADMPRYLAAMRTALRPGGLFHIGMKLGTGEERDCLGRHYAYYTEEELCDLLRDAGLTPFSSRQGSDPGLSGKVEPWVVIAAHG